MKVLFSQKGSASSQPSQNPLSMQFCKNGPLNENSFKISLKPQNALKQPASQCQTTPPIPSTVTSTNPKTPSPSTNDVRSNRIKFANSIFFKK